MSHLITLLVAVALLSLYTVGASSVLDDTKLNLDNNLQPNAIPSSRKRMRNSLRIFTAPPELALYVPGSRLELECEVSGSPAPSVRWLKNDEPLVTYEEEVNEIPSGHTENFARLTSKLVVASARDGDVFTCVATSGLKEDSASTTIYSQADESTVLLEKLMNVHSKPTITSFYNGLLQDMGTTAILPCRAQSATENQLYWINNQANLVYNNSRIRVLPSGDLMISGLRWSDMGEWTCVVKNAHGKDSVSTFLYPMKPTPQ